jgi:O-methyltransferase involved in polyketide biosynthesis
MEKLRVDFTGARITAFITLYLRWRDSLDRRSLLNDSWAGGVVEGLAFDFGQLAGMNYTRFTIAARSRILDDWVRQYLSDNPGAIVLDLGSGFDSRVFRVDPARGHHWYDVDFPDVIAVRNQLYSERHEHTAIGASVADPDWLDQIPGDRPVIVVADTVLMFLAEDEVRTVFRRIVDHFPRGEFVFTTYSSLVKRREAKRGRPPLFVKYGVTPTAWTYDDRQDVEKFDDRLRYLERRSQTDLSLHARAPLYDRLMCALVNTTRSGKYAGSLLRFRF